MRPHHNTTSPKNLHGTWTCCFFLQHFQNLVGCRVFRLSILDPKVMGVWTSRWCYIDVDSQVAGGRWFQVFPGIFTLLGGWCSCSILRRLFCFQVAQPPTRISSNLIQWDVPNPKSGKTIFLPWMGYLNVYSPKISGRAALWMFYFDGIDVFARLIWDVPPQRTVANQEALKSL